MTAPNSAPPAPSGEGGTLAEALTDVVLAVWHGGHSGQEHGDNGRILARRIVDAVLARLTPPSGVGGKDHAAARTMAEDMDRGPWLPEYRNLARCYLHAASVCKDASVYIEEQSLMLGPNSFAKRLAARLRQVAGENEHGRTWRHV